MGTATEFRWITHFIHDAYDCYRICIVLDADVVAWICAEYFLRGRRSQHVCADVALELRG